MKAESKTAGQPWSSRAETEVSQLRKAVTAHLDETMVTSPAAPMMGELLTRLDEFSQPRDVGELHPPEPPTDETEMSQGQAAAALHDACGALRDRILSGADGERTANTLRSMVDVIENHLSMKSEVVARSASDATPG